jgi:hypothetical protein
VASVLCAQGNVRTAEALAQPWTDAGGRTGILILIRDLTVLCRTRSGPAGRTGYGGLVGADPAMASLYDLIEAIGPSDAPVVIEGEAGVGKELVAQAIHARIVRSASPRPPRHRVARQGRAGAQRDAPARTGERGVALGPDPPPPAAGDRHGRARWRGNAAPRGYRAPRRALPRPPRSTEGLAFGRRDVGAASLRMARERAPARARDARSRRRPRHLLPLVARGRPRRPIWGTGRAG